MNNKKPTLIFVLVLVYITSFMFAIASPAFDSKANAQIGFPPAPPTAPPAPPGPPAPPPAPPPPPSVGADEEFTFYMNQAEEAAILDAIRGGAISATPNPMSQTAIYSKGGQFGNTPIQFRYVSKIGSNFIYQAVYYCNGSGNTSRTQTPDFPSKITVQIAAPLTAGYVQNGTGSGAGASFGQLTGQFSSPDSGKVIAKCLPTDLPSPTFVKSYKHMNASAQGGWGTLQTTAVAQAADVPGSEETADSNPDCDTTLSNPLSWIICPIIDLGANFTDAVFTTFVRPLLEDIPIGTDPTDSGYRAWQGFRALGNIMLVGCLLAIVYAQARGDK